MLTCPACEGLTPRTSGLTCLHCDGPLAPPRASWLRSLLAPAGAVLLAACYGGPGRFRAGPMTPTAVDRDGDGAPADRDCDDDDRNRFPGAADVEGDNFDQNCDGVDGWRDPTTKRASDGGGSGSDDEAPAP